MEKCRTGHVVTWLARFEVFANMWKILTGQYDYKDITQVDYPGVMINMWKNIALVITRHFDWPKQAKK